jgi:putative ABC transport system permease protein
METLVQDLRYAVRGLWGSRTFAITAILSLAVGISANTVVFSAVDAVLLRPLPYPDSTRLVQIFNAPTNRPGVLMGASTADLSRWRAESQIFEQLEMSSEPEMVAMSDPGHPERVSIQRVTPGILPMLGVTAFLGSIPSEQDLGKSVADPVFISYEFWRRHFHSDPHIIGRSFFSEHTFVTVVAVLSPGFDLFGEGPPDIVDPWGVDPDPGLSEEERWLKGFGKLKPGIALGQAQVFMNAVSLHLAEAAPKTNKDWVITLRPLHEALFGWTRPLLLPLVMAAAFLLLIACTNIASLLLCRTAGRRQEIGIRVALGGNRSRLIRQLLTESVLVSVLGGILGLLLSFWGVKFFIGVTSLWFRQMKSINIDGRVLAFTCLISILTGVAFGLAPAISASGLGVSELLRHGGYSSVSRSRHRALSIFVVAEVALALALLVCAGLMIGSLIRVLHANPGFDPNHLLTAEIRLTGKKYFDVSPLDKSGFDLVTPEVDSFTRHVVDRVRELPGVESAAAIDWLPMAPNAERSTHGFSIAGQGTTPHSATSRALFSAVTPDYFSVMSIPLRQGRGLTERDDKNAPWIVVVNETMARTFWPNQNPIGQIITLDTAPSEKPREIVGVVGDVRQLRLAREPVPEIYAPYPQQPAQCPPGLDETRLHKSIIVRTRVISKSLVESLHNTLTDIASDSPVFGITSVQQLVTNSAKSTSFFSQLLGAFALVALLLAALGIYGTIAYSVGERTREIGLRIALGAQPRQVLTLVLNQGLRLASVGIAIGLLASFVATPVLSSVLYGVTAHDPLTLLFVSVLLFAVGLLAAYIPGLRASRVDPMVSLRCE